MAYEKLNLTDGTVLTAEHLACLEGGIENSGGIGKVCPECVASGTNAHAEGSRNVASARFSHAEGYHNNATGEASHAEGWATDATDTGAHSEGAWTKASGKYSHAEGSASIASGHASHSEGAGTCATHKAQHVEGSYNIPDPQVAGGSEYGKYAHIVGNGEDNNTRSNAHTLDWNGLGWFAGGLKVGGTGQDDEAAQEVHPCGVQYVEQSLTWDQKHQARANIGCGSVGRVDKYTTAAGGYAHAEGCMTSAAGNYAHSEGFMTSAAGSCSHSEGNETQSSGKSSHAEGEQTQAIGVYSHAEGCETTAASECQHVQGRMNVVDEEKKYLHIVGNGGREGIGGGGGEGPLLTKVYSNAHTLDWDGVPWFAGDRVMLGGTGMDDENAVALRPIFVSQELTDDQKVQARANIGAFASEDTTVKVTSRSYQNSYKTVVTVNGVESEGPAMSLVRYDAHQTGLTEENKAQARANIGAVGISKAAVGQVIAVKAVDANGAPTEWETISIQNGTPTDAVTYTAQTLTDTQKAQARENIGAQEAMVVEDLTNQIVFNFPDNVTIQKFSCFRWGKICTFTLQFIVNTAITSNYGFTLATLPVAPVDRIWINNQSTFFIDGGYKDIRVNADTVPTGAKVLTGFFIIAD